MRTYRNTKNDTPARRKRYLARFLEGEAGRRSRRNTALKRTYGITLLDYERMVREQDGRCRICELEAKLHVDHNHATGVVRELLCGPCNRAVGMIRESLATAERLVAYLRQHG